MAIDEAEIDRAPAPAVVLPPPKPQKPHWAFTAIGIATILGLCYWGELVLAVMLVSVLLAFILAPVMEFLSSLPASRSGRGGGRDSALHAARRTGVLLLEPGHYFCARICPNTRKRSARKFRRSGNRRNPGDAGPERAVKNANPVPAPIVADLLTRGFGSVSQALLAASFVPFLVYFMLSWQHHVRSATVMLFSLENRQHGLRHAGPDFRHDSQLHGGKSADRPLSGTASTIAFAILGLPFFYFIGFISGFLSLVPYLGVVLAMAPPIFVSMGHISSGDAVVVVMIVLGLHLIALNVLYPKFLGNRLQLNPLAVTIALLVWGWLWGAMGLVLAVPITAAMKIVFDHIESLKPYGAWMGE